MTKLYFKILSISILCTFCISAKAQFTITSANLPLATSTAYYYRDTVPFATITEGKSGLNQKWDFTLLEKVVADTVHYLAPTGLPSASNFATATLASKKDSVYTYYQGVSTNYSVLGTATTHSGVVLLKPTYKLFKFPMTYQDSIKDTASYKTISVLDTTRKSLIKQYFGKTYDSTRTTSYTFRNNKIDGTGTVYTPADTFTNVMRIRRFAYTMPVIEFKDSATNTWEANATLSSYFGKKDTTIIYEWYSANYRSPVVTLTLKGPDEILKDVSYLTQKSNVYNGIAKIETSSASSAYPNPANNYITFSIAEPLVEAICIYDVNGKLIARVIVSSNLHEPITYNTNSLHESTYIYTLVNSAGTTISKGKFSVVK